MVEFWCSFESMPSKLVESVVECPSPTSVTSKPYIVAVLTAVSIQSSVSAHHD